MMKTSIGKNSKLNQSSNTILNDKGRRLRSLAIFFILSFMLFDFYIYCSKGECEMRINYTYNIIVNDIIVYTCTKMQDAIKAFTEIRKSEPKAWMQEVRS